MAPRNPSSTVLRSLAGVMASLVLVSAQAQAPQASVSSAGGKHTVALVTGDCQMVHASDAVTLDWNPGFESSWAVTGLNGFHFFFKPRSADNVTANARATALRITSESESTSSLGNGYFHVEASLPPHVTPGIYDLVEARVTPRLRPDFQGAAPRMTVSPTREHLCIKVVAAPPVAAQTQTPQN